MKTLALALVLAGAAYAAAPAAYQYEPATSKLSGVVKNDKTYFGPPGFGKDPKVDERDTPFRLVLDAPISITPQKDDPTNEAVSDVRELTLVPNEVPDLKPYLDRRVTVTGKLFQAHTAHHHTPALIALDTIDELKEPSKSTR